MSIQDDSRNRFINAAIDKFRPKQPPKSPVDLLLDRAQDIVKEVQEIVKPVLAAGGWRDQPALQQLLEKELLERFARFDRHELTALVTVMHVGAMMQSIAASPYGDFNNPDLLSGV